MAGGNRLPAVPAYTGCAEIRWRPGWADWSLQCQLQSKLYVDDRDSQSAPGYRVVSLAAARDVTLGAMSARLYFRLKDLLDKNYVSAVIVNEVNDRYFEPAPGRNWLAGVDVRS